MIRHLSAQNPKLPPRTSYLTCENHTVVRIRHMSYRWVLFPRPASFSSRIIYFNRPPHIGIARGPRFLE